MYKIKKIACSLMLLSYIASANAVLPNDTIGSTVLSEPDDHRSYMIDFDFENMVSTRIVVLDPDTRKYLGMIPTGGAAPAVLSHNRETVYTADFFYSRYVRGERSDVLTAWDTKTLSPKWELKVPSRRAFTITERFSLSTSTDDQFVYVYNFTPSTSVTVIDTAKQEMVNEIAINGCILNYPIGKRRFASLCGDGAIQVITIDDKGQEVDRIKEVFFNPNEEKLVERATVIGDIYYFVTTEGVVVPLDLSEGKPKALPRWSLVTDAEKLEGWAPGGWQLITAAPSLNRLYVLMHPDHVPYKWEDPSNIIWVFDLKTGEKISTMESPNLIWSLTATTDKKPLLLGTNIEGGMDIFDITTGQYQGTMDSMAKTPTLILTH